jgi:tetratricopeptide (TPR) repeat protein
MLGALLFASALAGTPAPDMDSALDLIHPSDSEARLIALRPAVAADHSRAMELETLIARAQTLQEHLGAARGTLEAVEQALRPNEIRGRIRYQLELGRLCLAEGDIRQAVQQAEQALELAHNAGEPTLAIDAAHVLTVELPPPSNQLLRSLEALRLSEGSTDPKERLRCAYMWESVGWAYHDLGLFADSLRAFQSALVIFREQDKEVALLSARWKVAYLHRLLGQADQALAEQTALALDWARSTAEPAPGPIDAGGSPGFVYEELAELLLAHGDAKAARPQFARAYAILSQDAGFAADQALRLERMRRLGGMESE